MMSRFHDPEATTLDLLKVANENLAKVVKENQLWPSEELRRTICAIQDAIKREEARP